MHVTGCLCLYALPLPVPLPLRIHAIPGRLHACPLCLPSDTVPIRCVCLVTLSLSEAGTGYFGGHSPATESYHATSYHTSVRAILATPLLYRSCVPTIIYMYEPRHERPHIHSNRAPRMPQAMPPQPRRWRRLRGERGWHVVRQQRLHTGEQCDRGGPDMLQGRHAPAVPACKALEAGTQRGRAGVLRRHGHARRESGAGFIVGWTPTCATRHVHHVLNAVTRLRGTTSRTRGCSTLPNSRSSPAWI